MSARKQADKKSINIYLIPALILGIIFASTLVSFGYNMIDSAKEQVEADYQDEVKSICHLYEKEIYAAERETILLANYLFEQESIISDENIEYLKNAANSIGAKDIYIVNTDYSAIDIYNETTSNIKENEVYSEIFEKNNKSLIFAKNNSGEMVSYIVKPISSKTLLRGYLAVEFVPEIMDNLISSPTYSSKKNYALISSEGVLIEAAGTDDLSVGIGENIIDAAQDMTFTDGTYTSFRQAVRDGRTGSVKVVNNDKGKNVYYGPVSGSKAIVMMQVDSADVERTFAKVSKSIRSMLLELGITIVVFLIVIIAISFFNKAKYYVESEDLQNKADTDLLTDLYNKMATERMIKEYLEGEGKNSVSMLFVLDVDNFKKINDTMGHAFGDEVLSQLGHQIRAWFRVNDIVGRIGGDEFMVFIKDVKDPEVIKREGSRIMQFFEGFNVGEYTRYSPTASVGGAVYPNDGTDFESLYKSADKAVYKSKKEGKNRVSFYGDLNIIEKDAIVEKDED